MAQVLQSVARRYGRLVIVAAIGVVLLAAVQARGAAVDVYPQFTPPTVQIQTEALGLSAAEVEQLVTVPIEQDLLNGVPWLDHMSSDSQPGLSVITLVFDRGTDLYAARQMVQERMTQAHALPNVGSPPMMVQPEASVGRVAMVGLSSSDVSLLQMSVLARWKIRPRLMGIPGVANVSVYGQRDRQLQVQVDPRRLEAAGITLTQVITTAGNALWVSPLSFVEASTPGTGGFVEGPNQRLAVQHVLPITDARRLAQVPLQGHHVHGLRLGDVTNVVEDHQPLIGDALTDGSPSLYLVVDKFPGADTRQVTHDVEAAMAEMAPGLSGITVTTDVYRPASFVDASLRSVGLAGLAALALLVLVLLLFLSWRGALVAGAAIVVSLSAAILVLELTGAVLTSLTLLGLALACLLVANEAVHEVAAVQRQLRLERPEDDGQLRVAAVGRAVLQTQSALVYATLVALVVTLPFLVLGALVTAFTRPLVLAYALALGAALLVSLTLTPVLGALVLDGRAESRLPTTLRSGYRRLTRARAWRTGTGAVVAAALGLALLAGAPQLGGHQVLPTLHDRDLLVTAATLPGTSLEEMDRVTAALATQLRQVPGIETVGAHVGRAVTSDRQQDVNTADLWLRMATDADYQKTWDGVVAAAKGFPGVHTEVSTYGQQQVAAAEAASAGDLTVRLFGEDLAALGAEADEVLRRIAGVQGIRSPTVERAALEPVADVQVDLAAAQRYGLRPGDVRREATTLTSGLTVGSLYQDAKVFDVVVRGVPSTDSSIQALRSLSIGTPSGADVPLSSVASVAVEPQPVAIHHDDVFRSIDVTAGISGRDAAAVVADVRSQLEGMTVPAGTHLQVLSNAELRQGDVRRGLLYGAAALVIVYLLLQAATHSWRRGAILLVGGTLGAAGAVLVAPLAGGLAAAGVRAALLTTVLLTLQHGLVLVRHTSLAESAGATTDRACAGAAASLFVPVMTSTAAVVAVLLPVVLLGDRAGLELLHPFALAGCVGAVTAALVATVVHPLLLPALSSRRPPALIDLTTSTGLAPVPEPDRSSR